MLRTILITGATSGFGRECAIGFAKQKDRIIITGRRKERLLDLQQQLLSEFGVEVLPLVFDVRDPLAVKSALEGIPQEWRTIDVLVNNAGLASGLSFIQEGDLEDWERMIDTNVKGLLYVSRIIAPWMTERGKGHIVNIGSIAGREVYPKGNVYCATKFAVDAISQALRIDLLPYGIRVSLVSPGAAETEFSLVRYRGDEQKAKDVYKGFTPLSAKDVAEAVLWITGLPEHVNINEMVIMPTAQASPAHFHKKL